MLSDVFGVSGRAMLKALIEGRASVEEMADLAKRQLRRKRSDLILALEPRRHARAALAIAHKILVSAYHMLAKGWPTAERRHAASSMRARVT